MIARTTPPTPPNAILLRLIPAPIGIIMKNVMIGIASAATLRNVLSRFPQIIPMIRGISVAINDSIGMEAIPAVPIAIIVKNGPSFSDKIDIAPASVSSPYCCASPKYNPPAEFVIPAIIAMEVIPQNPAAPPILATRSPRMIPTMNFISVSVHPLYSGIPIFFTSMDAPFSKRNIPNRQAVPVLNIPDVNPPISSTFGINVLASTPISIGTMINPPGTFCISLKKLFSSFILSLPP